MKEKETGPDVKPEQAAAERAASNERLVEVSNKRISSFVGFQQISGSERPLGPARLGSVA